MNEKKKNLKLRGDNFVKATCVDHKETTKKEFPLGKTRI